MRKYVLLLVLVLSYLAIISSFTSHMKNRPFLERMGYTPEPLVLKFFSADQYRLSAAFLIVKVISYYGSLVEQYQNKIYIPPEYPEMGKTIETAVKLDPYNMDSYYFAQAIMIWGASQVKSTNELLEYGMQYRTWDFYLAYFAGFNYAFFLKDYANAAKYYKRVGELTGADLPMNLAGRYMYESGRTDLAVAYLSSMVKSSTNDAVKKSLQTRLDAFQGVGKIEQACTSFLNDRHRRPRSVEELVQKGYLEKVPVDPYGGTYYLDKQGKVRSTSKFAYGVASAARERTSPFNTNDSRLSH